MRATEEPSAAGRTLTFLFTDIEGSTKRWERYPQEMAKAVARHDEIMRAAILEHNGHVFKTVGDAFCAVFPSAKDAIDACVTAQQRLSEEDWGVVAPIRVRMGLHTGEAEERNDDFFGPTVNRVARITSAGHGGQTLLSSATGERVGGQLPPTVKVRDLGHHRLKDLARPERILQLMAAGLPAEFPKLKTVPSPTPGIWGALLASLVPLVVFRVANKSSSEAISPSLLSPLSLYTGLKGLVIELSTLNEWVLLAVGLLLLLLALGIVAGRWRAARRVQELRPDDDEGRFGRWIVNQRMAAFFGVLALLVLGAYGYQQYLWRVALPIPENAFGIAMTREASASVVQEQLADSLYEQGQDDQVIIRELPVVFDARDTEKARDLGQRIDAHAVIIYRTDETPSGEQQYIAYVVFTNPSIGLTLAGQANGTEGPGQPLVVREGVPVPVLRTDTIEELVNASAGIIAYDTGEARRAIQYLELAVPEDPESANTGIINFYLGNAYSLDNQTQQAVTAWERTTKFYEQRIDAGEVLGPQDQLILAKTYMERGRAASMAENWEEAISWYERAVSLRADLLANVDGLERPTDLHATYARLFALMADAYRYMGLTEDQRSWQKRAQEEIDALISRATPGDTYALVQQSTAQVFSGSCTDARSALDTAIAKDPTDVDALMNAGIIAMLLDRPDLARQYWQRIIDADPNDVQARMMIANSFVLAALPQTHVEPEYLLQAESTYREIIAIDPANVEAHRSLAGTSALRADMITIDSTALSIGDDLTVAKSQYEWPRDPARQDAVIDIYGVIIDEYRLIASELEPGSPEAEIAVAEAYVNRQMFLYSALVGPLLEGERSPRMDELGEQILDDSAQVSEWTTRVLENPNATRIERLRAWAALVQSLDREWGWYSFMANDVEKANEAKQRYQDAVTDALAYIEQEEVSSIDEIPAIRIVYFQAYFIESQFTQDTEAADAHMAKIDELTSREFDERHGLISHYSSFCTEQQAEAEATELLADGDVDGARERYQAALKANPEHVPSLRGYAEALYIDGDIDAAIEQATAATLASPGDAGPWADLVVYHLANGDTNQASDALEQFLAIIGKQPPQSGINQMEQLVSDLEALLGERPELASDMVRMVDSLSTQLDAMPPEELPSYQRPQLYARLGKLALYLDDAALAEPMLRTSLELDPRSPETHALLVISLLVQEQDAGPEMDRALDEVNAPHWLHIYGFEDPSTLKEMMLDEVEAYGEAFPEREEILSPFVERVENDEDSAAEPTSGVEGSVYTSATHGYSLTWDEPWSVVESSTDRRSGVDFVHLENGSSTVQLSTVGAAEDPAGCVQSILVAVESDEGWATVVPARDRDGADLSQSSDELAYEVFIDGAESEAAPLSVYYIGCSRLPESDTLLLAIVFLPIEGFEEQRVQVNELLASIDLTEQGDTLEPDPLVVPEVDTHAR